MFNSFSSISTVPVESFKKLSLILLCLIGFQKYTSDSLPNIVEDLLSLTWPNSKSTRIISDLCFCWTQLIHNMTRFMGVELQDFVNLSVHNAVEESNVRTRSC